MRIGWKLKFCFFYNPKRSAEKEVGEDTEFNGSEFMTQSLTKVNWSYDVLVRSCVNPKFNDELKERCRMNGKEETVVL